MSREIDIQVRDHVIRRPNFNQYESCGWPLKESVEDGCVTDHCSMRPLPEREDTNPPPYSTDIAAAWQVVQTLRPARIDFIYWPSHDAWQCNIGDGPLTRNYRMTQDAWQHTAPLAICLAALKAVGLTVAEE
jgi:hypothetical protein